MRLIPKKSIFPFFFLNKEKKEGLSFLFIQTKVQTNVHFELPCITLIQLLFIYLTLTHTQNLAAYQTTRVSLA